MEVVVVLHPISRQVRSRGQVVTLRSVDCSSAGPLCMVISGDLGFTAGTHRVLEV
jgi:hypothetical protein